MSSDPSEPRQRAVPSGRVARFGQFGRLAAGISGGMVAEGARRLAAGGRPRISDLLLTPANVGRLAERLSHLRGATMKLGQVISMDAGDFLPAELTQLRPIAAASIGQVHRATTRDGRLLAIKVQYPGVRASINADVDNVATLLRVSGLLPKELDIAPLLAEAKRQLAEEADYEREGAQMALVGRLLANDPALVVPLLDEEFTTANVLAMSFVEGQPIESLVDAPQAVRDGVVTTLITLVLRELFEFGVMQTDPNFANYRFQPETVRLVLLDFGAARAIPPETSLA